MDWVLLDTPVWVLLGTAVVVSCGNVLVVLTVQRSRSVHVSGASWPIALLSGPLLAGVWPLIGALGPRLPAAMIGSAAALGFAEQMLMLALSREARRDQERRDDRADALGEQAVEAYRSGRDPVTPFALYLRAFNTTNRLATEPISVSETGSGEVPPHLDLELALVAALRDELPLIAAGRPDDIQGGAGRIPMPEHLWRQIVIALAETASMLVIVPSANAGTLAELAWIRQRNKLSKTLFVMPQQRTTSGGQVTLESWTSRPFGWPLFKITKTKEVEVNHKTAWDAAVVAAARIGLKLPAHLEEGALFTLTEHGELRSIVPLDLPALGARRVRRLREVLAEVRTGTRVDDEAASWPAEPEGARFEQTVHARIKSLAHRLVTAAMCAAMAFGVTFLPGWWSWLWIPIAWLGVREFIEALAGVWRYPVLRFDGEGITLRSPAGFLLRKEEVSAIPWGDIHSAYTRLGHYGPVLAVVPMKDSPLEKEKKKRDAAGIAQDDYVVARLAPYGLSPEIMAAVLERYSDGRHRRPCSQTHVTAMEPVEPLRAPEQEQKWTPGRVRVLESAENLVLTFFLSLAFSVSMLVVWYLLARNGDGLWYLLSFLFGVIGAYMLARTVPATLDGKKVQVDQAGLTVWETDGRVPVHLAWDTLSKVTIEHKDGRATLSADEHTVDLDGLSVTALHDGLARYAGERYVP